MCALVLLCVSVGLYFTGDGCRRDADGYLWITGRVDGASRCRVLHRACFKSLFIPTVLLSLYSTLVLGFFLLFSFRSPSC